MYIERTLTDKLLSLARQFPVVSINGPRQSGKTTLVRTIFPRYRYLSLENPDQLDFALTDPRAFLEGRGEGMIIDEAQRAPHLLSYIQGIVDEMNKPGMFILTGSHNFLLLEKITQSLAGRAGIVTLLPFSLGEYTSHFPSADLDRLIIRGMYPRIYDKDLDAEDWYAAYVTTYVERDVRSIKNIENLTTFRNFLKLCAGRSGQILNLSSLGDDCGITHNTARSWISVLEASYIVSLLPPYYENFNKRIIKTPKLYFLDTGLLCYLLGISSLTIYETHPLRGPLFETYIYSELYKLFSHRGKRAGLYFWRDKTGHEIDFIIPGAADIYAIEVKAGRTVTSDYFRNLAYWKDLSGAASAYLIYRGEEEQKRSAAHVLPVLPAFKRLAEAIGL